MINQFSVFVLVNCCWVVGLIVLAKFLSVVDWNVNNWIFSPVIFVLNLLMSSMVLNTIINGISQLASLRADVFARDGFQCVFCKSRRILHAHHIIYPKNIKDDKKENIVTCCKRCHRISHALEVLGFGFFSCLSNAIFFIIRWAYLTALYLLALAMIILIAFYGHRIKAPFLIIYEDLFLWKK